MEGFEIGHYQSSKSSPSRALDVAIDDHWVERETVWVKLGARNEARADGRKRCLRKR
jgi:hypothetical protein